MPEESKKQVEWHQDFDERQLKQIAFARIYARDFSHGADGHNNMLIIAKLADHIDVLEAVLTARLERDKLNSGE